VLHLHDIQVFGLRGDIRMIECLRIGFSKRRIKVKLFEPFFLNEDA
jgi:hypothetical protein